MEVIVGSREKGVREELLKRGSKTKRQVSTGCPALLMRVIERSGQMLPAE
jgi:hypothetical protein